MCHRHPKHIKKPKNFNDWQETSICVYREHVLGFANEVILVVNKSNLYKVGEHGKTLK